MKLAIFTPPDSDTISVLIPAPNCNLTLDEICKKDVPSGVKYKVIEHTDLPNDREFRNAWSADFSNPDGYGA